MNHAILIQAALFNWSGGQDDSAKKLDGKLLIDHVIRTIKECVSSRLPDVKIILVVPDDESNAQYFRAKAEEFKLAVYFGDVDDVLTRLLLCCRENGIEKFARINGAYWYLDVEFFIAMFEHHVCHNEDLLTLPCSFPKGFSAEFSTLTALEKLAEIRNKHTLGNISSPFACMGEYENEFGISIYPSVPQVSAERVSKIRQGRKQYEPERVEFDVAKLAQHASVDFKRYAKASTYLSRSNDVLDIACGNGYGSDLLSSYCRSVVGADADLQVISYCTSKYTKTNLGFVHQDVTAMSFSDEIFDAVVSMETFEHVASIDFVNEVARVLKPQGLLLMSTPQNDWGFTLVPWHIKEYSLDEIRHCLTQKFEIIKIHGINSHEISDISEVGDRMLIVAQKM